MITKLGGIQWINELKETDYAVAKEKLLQLPGIGPKVYYLILFFYAINSN